MPAITVAWVVHVASFPAVALGQVELEAIAERAAVGYDEVPRKVLAFYYPWYGNPEVEGGSGRWAHWSKVDEAQRQIGSSTHYPTLGPYDSHDPKLIAQHVAWAKEAGVDGFIASWWGKNSFSDRALPRLLEGCRKGGLEVTVYYETVPGPKNAEAAADDVVDLLRRHAAHPAWLRVDGKPVVFVYGRALGEIGLTGWLEAIGRVNRGFPQKAVFLGDQISRPAAQVFDGVHTYNTAGALRGKSPAETSRWARTAYPAWVETADALGRISTITVIPGYDDTKIRSPALRVERFDGALYRSQWEAALGADPHWILITSWNEWHEGSEIEPSLEDGDGYLKSTAGWTSRFKALGPRVGRRPVALPSLISKKEKAEQLARLEGLRIGLLPEAGLSVILPLLEAPRKPSPVSWEEVAGWDSAAARRYPLVVYAGGETYRRTVERTGDVDDGLVRYLRGGGLLLVLPSGPMPLHYDRQGSVAAASRKLGLPLSISGPDGGWEEPPQGVALEFVPVGGRLPHLPRSFPFPAGGDRRWRPLVRSQLSDDHLVVPLVELRDEEGNHYGDAAAYVEHKAGELEGAKVLYAWFGLLDTRYGEALLYDLFAFAADRARQ
jgi:hypothetical protein